VCRESLKGLGPICKEIKKLRGSLKKLCEREKVGGLWVEKKIEEGVLGQVPFFFPSIQDRIRGGGAQGRPADGGRRPSRAWRRPGVGGTERGGRGRLVLVLTSGWGGLWREIDGGGRSVTAAACGGRRWELGGERGKCLGGAGRGGERCWAIYRRGKAVERLGAAHAELVLACQ
jgi:hypothetical protein